MEKTRRQSNFELLRCVLMLCVIIVHYNSTDMGGALVFVNPGSINDHFIRFMESAAIICVNGFILLTGYFGYKRTTMTLRKPLGLLLYVLAYNYLFYFLDVFMGRAPFTLQHLVFQLIPNNWYVVLYITLLLISPYLNIVVNQLNRKNMLVLLCVFMILFSIWSTVLDIGAELIPFNVRGNSTVALSGTQAGYSIVNFVLLYFIGAAMHKWELFSWSRKKDILLYFAMVILIFVTSLFVNAAWNYSCTLVILSSVFLFNYFRKLVVRSDILNKIAGAAGVYLISTKGLVVQWFWRFFKIKEACNANIVLCAVDLILCAVVTFLLCAAIDTGCRCITSSVSKKLDRINVLNKKIIDLNGGITE